MKNFFKYGLLIFGWLVAGIVFLIVIAGVLLQTQPVKKKITSVAQEKVSDVLKGDITIGKIDGNFFTSLSLENILWLNESDTIAFIQQFDARYELRPLLKSKLLVHSAHISNPYFYLKQNKDSTWSVQNLVEQTADDKSTKKSSGSFNMVISNFEIEEGNVKIDALDTIVPQRINHMNTKLDLDYSSESQNLMLNNLSFSTSDPTLILEKLSFNAERNSNKIRMEDFYLKTANNKLEASANYVQDTLLDATANIESAPLHLNEFEFFLPGLTLPASPTLNISTSVKKGHLEAKIILADKDQQIALWVNSENFAQFLNNTKTILLQYDVEGTFQNIDLANWLGDPQLDYLVNGRLQIKGKGTDPETAVISLNGDFKDCIIKEKPVDKLTASLHLKNGNLDGKVEGEGNFGTINITPEIKDLQGTPSYRLKLITRKFNLAEITGNDSLQSDINLIAQIEGENFDPKRIRASSSFNLSNSRFQEVVFDTLVAQARYQSENIQIDSLWTETQTVKLNASGNYNLHGNSDLILKAGFTGLEEFARFIPAEQVFAEGEIDARLKGITDSLNVETRLILKDVQYDDFTTDNIAVTAKGQLTQRDTTFNARITANKFRAGKLLLDSVNFDVGYLADSLFVDGRGSGDDVKTNLTAGINLGKSQKISVEDWAVDFKNQHFELQNPPAVFELDSSQYKISNFKLISNLSDSAQYIMADGLISRGGEEDFRMEVANINIQQLLEMFEIDFAASGIINVKADLKGTAKSPLLTGRFSVDNATLNEYGFTDFSGDIGLKERKLSTDINIVPSQEGRLKLSGVFPVLAELDSMKFNLNPKDSLDANLIVEKFPLAVLQNIEIAKNIEGYIEGNVDVKGTLEAPDPKGNFHLVDASLEVPEYGIDYKELSLNIEFFPEAVKLDSFYIKSKDGNMKASGTIDFSTAFYKGDVSESEINVEFNDFNPVDHRQFNMQLSGDANLKGKKGEVVFSGDLNIPESEIYLPAIFNMMGRMSAPEIPDPILVREMKNMQLYKDSLTFVGDTIHTDSFDFSYLDNFTGTLNLKIPKNSWIKNKDMHIEISGDVELRKNKDFFELFGSVDVVRGQYDLLGKTFIIDDGTIGFQGGEELMPRIDITASYTFRNSERAQQTLTVQVSGTAEEPNVNFSLDGSNVSEGDALSYILFGKSMDELSIDQQQNVAGAGSLAGTAAAAILSSQLNNFLGENLDVDYIEIKSDGDFDNATVVVGKYITNDLFVSYEQRFGETDEKEMAKYEVKLEYELFKFLFLQLNNSSNDSGFDIIFKLSSE
ncbi:translocation/assembly module TamB domain-containing protein [Maribellus comscasis]|nr:translocation/assembly module TamB [Maribellus comscasis]